MMPSKNTTTTKKTAKRTAKRKEPRPREKAVAVMEFMNSGKIPDFFSRVVMETIDRTCDHFDYVRLMYEPGTEKADLEILANVCRRTKLFNLDELDNNKAGLARHIAAIYRHPLTPVRLYNSVADFVTDGANLKVSVCEIESDSLVDTRGNVSMAEEWTWQPKTIERVIDMVNKYDDAGEVSHATTTN